MARQEVRLILLVSVSLVEARGNPTKRPSHFITLKTPVYFKYYRDCVLKK